MTNKIYDMTDVWNDINQIYSSIKMNVTDNYSSANSSLMDLQIQGTSKFKISKSGEIINGTIDVSKVNNLANSGLFPPNNATYLVGYTWSSPASIGTSVANSANFTSVNASSYFVSSSFSANTSQVVIKTPLNSNGSFGSAGQVLTSNGSTGSPYWSSNLPFLFTRAAAISLKISSFVNSIVTSGYSTAGDGGGATYVRATGPFSDGSSFQSADGAWWKLSARDINVAMFGAVGDGTTDDKAACQAAINFVGPTGGRVLFGAKTYALASSLSVPYSSVQLAGIPGATMLKFTAANTQDRIILGTGTSQSNYLSVVDMNIIAPNATGGSAVFFNWCGDSRISNVQMYNLGSSNNGIKIWQCNTIRIQDMRIVNPTQAGIYAYGTDTARTDVVDIINVIVSGTANNGNTYLPAFLELDGFVNTFAGTSWKAVDCGRGLYCHNSVGSTQRGEFIFVHDFEVDFPYYEGIRVDYHDSLFFSNVYVNNSLTTSNVILNTNSPNTTTNISFIGGQCTNAAKQGFYINSNHTKIVGMEISGNSKSSYGSYPGIELGPNSQNIIVTACTIGSQSGVVTQTQSYGVLIDSGATYYSITGNDLTQNITGPLLDNSNFLADGSSATLPNMGQISQQSLVIANPTSGSTISVGRYQCLAISNLTTLSALTVLLPPTPVYGQRLQFWTEAGITSFTLQPNSGQNLSTELGNITTLPAASGFKIEYADNTKAWYRVW